MDFKTAKINGQDIMRSSTSGILYTSKEWRRLSVSEDSKNISGYHGRIVSPTYARARVITLEGIIDRQTEDGGLSDVSYLQDIFALQGNFLSTEASELYIKDMYDQEWVLNVKVRDPLEILEGNEDFRGSHWKWRVVLESMESPIYTSAQAIEIFGIETQHGGFTIPFKLSMNWEEVSSFIECTTVGNIETPARIEITATGSIESRIKIENRTNKTFFGVQGNMSPGDTLVIDSKEKIITRNGVNALGDRMEGSIWPFIKGTTIFTIEDLDGGFESSDLDIKISFSNSLL